MNQVRTLVASPSRGLFHVRPVPFSARSKGIILHGVALIFQEVDSFVGYCLIFLKYTTPGMQR